MCSSAVQQSVVNDQLSSLDDTDCYASAWQEALEKYSVSLLTDNSNNNRSLTNLWGGRGRGGRALARRTIQPHDVILDDVYLEYIGGGESGSKSGKNLLDDATLKLLSKRVYALTGRNGCGKSTLLRRLNAKKIPGFPPHLSTLYVPQEVTFDDDDDDDYDDEEGMLMPQDVVVSRHKVQRRFEDAANVSKIQKLEEAIEALDMTNEDDQRTMERLCEDISNLEGEGGLEGEEEEEEEENVLVGACDALRFFGVDDPTILGTPMKKLSGGLRKKVILASAMFGNPDILMLDEPTNHLDCLGILQLRRWILSCKERNITVIIVSHDIDLINDVATDVIHMSQRKLSYYPGNYFDFVRTKTQNDIHKMKQGRALEKQRAAMMNTIDNLKKQGSSMRGDKKKKAARAIECRKKKLERHGIEKDEHGHRFTAQKAGTGIRVGAINGMDASKRKNMSHTQLLKQAETKVSPVPDKEVQFQFRDPASSWSEPLIMAMDVGHGFGLTSSSTAAAAESATNEEGRIVKRDGMLFDCVDLCINEGSRTCILGANGSGKSTLLKILTGSIRPLEGRVHRAQNANVCYFHQHVADDLIRRATSSRGRYAGDDAWGGEEEDQQGNNRLRHHDSIVTSLSLLMDMFPEKSEQDLRGELTSFGLSPVQASTNVKYLSGGERCRLCLAVMMLGDPHVLILDEPSNHLDPESVEALAYGIKQWKGTVVMVSHDSNLIRMVGGIDCYVLMEKEGKLRRISGGIDSYLKVFALGTTF